MDKDRNKKDKRDPSVEVAKISAWQAIVVALITLVSSVTGTYFVTRANIQRPQPGTQVVPPPVTTKTVEAFGEMSDAAFQLLRDNSIFDLRSWRQVPESEKDNRYSPANYINYLHVKKVKPVKNYYARYSTPGHHIIDLRCITHHAQILRREQPKEHPGENEYAIEVDVSEMPVNQEFLIVIEATYWNIFQNQKEEMAATYTDEDITALGELGLIVLFPENKPFTGYSLWSHPNTNERDEQYILPSILYPDKGGKFIYWSITTRKTNSTYTLKWTW